MAEFVPLAAQRQGVRHPTRSIATSEFAPPPAQTLGWVPGPGPLIHLMPGQLHFSHGLQLKTLLGSCVALTLWHPERHIGGMCHYLLPSRTRRADEPLDGRYGDEAVQALVAAITRARASTRDFICHLYGGADTLPEGGPVRLNIGERNIEQGWNLIDQHGFQLDGVDVGDDVPRHVDLDLRTGLVGIRRGLSANPRGTR